MLDQSSMWLSDEAAGASVQFADIFILLYLKLAYEALVAKRPRWKMRPKYHSFFCEIINRTRAGSRINPRHVGCAGDEDMVGKVCGILKGSLHPVTLGKRILERCLLGINVRLMTLRADHSQRG